MLEQLIYKNHINEVIEFGKNGVYANIGDLRDYAWNVTVRNNRVSAFNRETGTRTLPVVIMCSSEAEGLRIKNKLFEVMEKDVLAKQYGKLYCGDYYMQCYVTESTKGDYLYSKRYMTLELTLTTDSPYWVKETVFSGGVVSDQITTGLDYSYDFPYDFTSSLVSQYINNANFTAANFRIIIYGECVNPTITIGDHVYQVNCTVNTGEYLTIDSVTKKVFLTDTTGKVTNKFNSRNKNSYIFEKIPVSTSSVAWDGSFGFDVILLEERSEPKWI